MYQTQWSDVFSVSMATDNTHDEALYYVDQTLTIENSKGSIGDRESWRGRLSYAYLISPFPD